MTTDTDALVSALKADLTDQRRQELSAFLRQTCHDINNPLGTMGLEMFSLDEILGAVVDALGSEAVRTAATDLAELETIVKNLGQAQGKLEAHVKVLHTFARDLGR